MTRESPSTVNIPRINPRIGSSSFLDDFLPVGIRSFEDKHRIFFSFHKIRIPAFPMPQVNVKHGFFFQLLIRGNHKKEITFPVFCSFFIGFIFIEFVFEEFLSIHPTGNVACSSPSCCISSAITAAHPRPSTPRQPGHFDIKHRPFSLTDRTMLEYLHPITGDDKTRIAIRQWINECETPDLVIAKLVQILIKDKRD